jgi:hypothetical protein
MNFFHSSMKFPLTRLLLCMLPVLSLSAEAVVESPESLPVMGHAPTAETLRITNISAPGKGPAQDDELRADYDYTDPDGDQEDLTKGVFGWSAAGSPIAGATSQTYVPGPAQNKQFLRFNVTPGSVSTADPDMAEAPVTSLDTESPVLPPRAQLASEYERKEGGLRWGDAYMHCAGLNLRLPSVDDLQALFTTYTRSNVVGEHNANDMNQTYGWSGGEGLTWTTGYMAPVHMYVFLGTTGVGGKYEAGADRGPYQVACAKFGTPELLPSVTAVSVPAATVGTPVTAVYTYNGNATIPDRSRFQWYTATAGNGTTGKTAINGATTKTYTPVAADSGKWLVIEITPASYDTVVGTPVTEVSAQPVYGLLTVTLENSSGGAVTGRPEVGSQLVAKVDCGGTCGPLTYQWQVETAIGSNVLENIPGATGTSYIPIGAQQGRGIQVLVDRGAGVTE